MENIKYIKRIDTNNKVNKYIDQQTIDFYLPKNKLDLSSFKIFYDVEIDPVAKYTDDSHLKRFMPRLSSSIIDSIIITNTTTGEELQHIKDYNVIYNILNDAQKEVDDIDGDRPDTLNYSYIDDFNNPKKICDFNNGASAIVISPLKYRFFINSFLGFIGENNRNIIDCTNTNIKISINLAPKFITYRGLKNVSSPNLSETYPTDYHYRLSNVFANVDIYPNDTPVNNQITFKHYHTIKGTKNDTKNTSLSYKHKGKLNYLIGTFVVYGENDTGLQLAKCNLDTFKFGTTFKTTYTDVDDLGYNIMTTYNASSRTIKSLTTEINLDNSLYFKRAGSNIKSSQYFMNGQAMTPIMDMPQIYNVAKEFFNNQMTRVKSLSSFEHEFFVFPMLINQQDPEYISNIEWICSAGKRENFDSYPVLFLCYDKTINL